MNISVINDIAVEAGKAVMEIYRTEDFGVKMKSDNSPLTLADKAAHKVIAAALQRLYPDIPLLSEEGKDIPYEERKEWKKFWLVDPLDGTKEFIKRNGEFTVNIALIENNVPVLGVIYVPVRDVLYYCQVGEGARKKEGDGKPQAITTVKNPAGGAVAVRSRSHPSEEEEKLFRERGIKDYISVGSSLKFCMVAEGKAQLYYRSGPTMEWDTAAGHAIVLAAGGQIEGDALQYNKPVLRNGEFCVVA